MTLVGSGQAQSRHTRFLFTHDETADRLSDRATDELRSLIITLELEPGTVLDEALLSHKLGYGRTPLREALQRLAGEGLAVILPRRAVAVSQITVTDLQQVYEARLVSEAACARLTAVRARSSDLAQIAEFIERLKPDMPAQDINASEVVNCDFKFHYAIARAAGNRYISESIRRALGPAMRLIFLAHRHGQPVRQTYDEHSAILTALRQQDPDAAEASIRRHILSAKERILSRL